MEVSWQVTADFEGLWALAAGTGVLMKSEERICFILSDNCNTSWQSFFRLLGSLSTVCSVHWKIKTDISSMILLRPCESACDSIWHIFLVKARSYKPWGVKDGSLAQTAGPSFTISKSEAEQPCMGIIRTMLTVSAIWTLRNWKSDHVWVYRRFFNHCTLGHGSVLEDWLISSHL